MKIGLSFSGCLQDIYTGAVPYGEVICIISSTKFKEIYDVRQAVRRYAWLPKNQIDTYESLATRLYTDGKLHQPRIFTETGIVGNGFSEHLQAGIFWLDLFSSKAIKDPAVKRAWDNYQLLAKLHTNG